MRLKIKKMGTKQVKVRRRKRTSLPKSLSSSIAQVKSWSCQSPLKHLKCQARNKRPNQMLLKPKKQWSPRAKRLKLSVTKLSSTQPRYIRVCKTTWWLTKNYPSFTKFENTSWSWVKLGNQFTQDTAMKKCLHLSLLLSLRSSIKFRVSLWLLPNESNPTNLNGFKLAPLNVQSCVKETWFTYVLSISSLAPISMKHSTGLSFRRIAKLLRSIYQSKDKVRRRAAMSGSKSNTSTSSLFLSSLETWINSSQKSRTWTSRQASPV